MSRRPLHRRAFTLIELLLVLVILAVLAAVVIPKMTGRMDESKRRATLAAISNLSGSIERFEVDNGRFPSSSEGLAALMVCPQGMENTWHREIEKELPVDSWGNPFIYIGPDQLDGSYNIISTGRADNQEGTDSQIDRFSK
jgi:general secretion pathway protein G